MNRRAERWRAREKDLSQQTIRCTRSPIGEIESRPVLCGLQNRYCVIQVFATHRIEPSDRFL